MGEVTIAAVCVARRIAILDDDTVFSLTNLIDDNGDETDDPDEAVVAVGQLPDGLWVTFDLREFGDAEPIQ